MKGEKKEIPTGKPDGSKLSRKVGEKIRRDKLNKLITQLAEEVPTIRYAQRRPDKLAILRLTVSYLKLHHGLKRRKIVSQCLKSLGCLYGAAKKATDGVIFIITESGSILFVSETVRNILGFHQMDVIGFSIEKFIHPDDMKTFNSQFLRQKATLATFHSKKDPSTIQTVEVHDRNKNLFYLRMLHASKKRQEDETVENVYELMHFSSFLDSGVSKTEREPWIVAFMKPCRRETIQEINVTVSEFMMSNEFATLHDLDGTILATDHRASLFHGYMSTEIVGTSPYTFVLEEDLEFIAISHQLILDKDIMPETVYRLKCQNKDPIYVQSRSVIVSDKWTKKPKCIVSVNIVYREEDGKKLLENQKRQLAELQSAADRMTLKDTPVNVNKSCNGVTLSQTSEDSVKYVAHSTDKSSNVSDFYLSDTGTHSDGTQSIQEVYEKQAKKYPDIYKTQLSSVVGKGNASYGVKRSFEDSEGCAKDSENSPEHEHKASIPKDCESELVNSFKTECARNEFKDRKTSTCIRTFKVSTSSKTEKNSTSKSVRHSQPILKGLLEGNLILGDFGQTNKSLFVPSNKDNDSKTGSESSWRSLICDAAASADDVSLNSGPDFDIGASEYIAQSPTVGSSGVQFKSKFAQQLHFKHVQLKKTLSTQRNALQSLRDQLELDPSTKQLDQRDSTVHKNLLGKIIEAENQVNIQSNLLGEIEEELRDQQESLTLQPVAE